MSKKPKKGNWIVRVERRVSRDVSVSDCTEEQARIEWRGRSEHEEEVAMSDWEVKWVEPND